MYIRHCKKFLQKCKWNLMICIDIRYKDGRSGCEGLWTNKGTELGSSSTGLLSWRRMVMAVHRLVQHNVVALWSLVDIICNFGTNNSTKKSLHHIHFHLFEFCRRVWPSYTATCERSRHGGCLSWVRRFLFKNVQYFRIYMYRIQFKNKINYFL